ncbi:hypothetical protein G4B88_019384 [Cannabis sativa]|uniref:SIS domain-containing protein n=1 Tax=Cannabis sativa TaxID=3483 RepID=A0A7J6HYW3_CANSA|nr:hypothetical protein G4B88_019384 [Cannabis sativa]
MASSNSMASLASEICNQISSIFSKPSSHPPVLDILVNEISSAVARNGRVFLYGVGREGLMLKALCMRLFHLGVSAHFVFDMTTPPIHGPQDLLISSAGPGGFSTVDALCSIARSNGARVLLLTAQPDTGSCVKHASVVGHVAAQTMADDESKSSKEKNLRKTSRKLKDPNLARTKQAYRAAPSTGPYIIELIAKGRAAQAGQAERPAEPEERVTYTEAVTMKFGHTYARLKGFGVATKKKIEDLETQLSEMNKYLFAANNQVKELKQHIEDTPSTTKLEKDLEE